MLFENVSGLTLLTETDALAVNGGHGCRRDRRRHHHHRRCGRGGDKGGKGSSNSVSQKGLININVEGNDDTVYVEVEV